MCPQTIFVSDLTTGPGVPETTQTLPVWGKGWVLVRVRRVRGLWVSALCRW